MHKSDLRQDLPLVSVIVAVFNGQAFLRAALQSIFDQDYSPLDVIVIDDGSTDNTAAIARSFKEARYFYQPNQGVAVARNTGLEKAKGEYISFLDADDLWSPNKLTLQIGYHLQHPEIECSFVKLINFLEPGIEKPWWLRDDQLHIGQVDYSPGTLVVRRAVFDRIGVFDPVYRVGEDTDWFARAVDAGVPIGVLTDVVMRRRIHGGNLSYAAPAVRLHTLAKILKASIDRKRASNRELEKVEPTK
jgi:glycosyltransferase involved in cell wall biosynthesis